MIGWLKGKVMGLDPSGAILLDTGGIGYEVSVSMQTLCMLKKNEEAEVFIHTHVREDQIALFGFVSMRERTVFRQLTGVSGIGARMALNILSGMSVEELLTAIDASDDMALARTPGIGKKTAQRMILELKGKLAGKPGTANAASAIVADVRSALSNLGYKPAQIAVALKGIEDINDLEKMFKAAMKALV